MEKSTRIDMPVMHLFIGYYIVPKNTAIILESISVHHIVEHMVNEKCDFSIQKNDNGEYIIIPDVSNVDLNHSMKFMVRYRKAYENTIRYKIKSEDIIASDPLEDIIFNSKDKEQSIGNH